MITLQGYLNILNYAPIYWGIFITIIPLIFLYNRKSSLETPFKFIFTYLGFKLSSDLLMLHLASVGQNNLYILNGFTLIRYICLSGVIYSLYQDSRNKKFMSLLSGIFLIFYSWDLYQSTIGITNEEGYTAMKYSFMIECIFMILWILLYYHELIMSLSIDSLLKSPQFITVAAWLLFYSSILFIAPLMTFMYRSQQRLRLGLLEFFPDLVEMLAIVICTYAVYIIPPKNSLK